MAAKVWVLAAHVLAVAQRVGELVRVVLCMLNDRRRGVAMRMTTILLTLLLTCGGIIGAQVRVQDLEPEIAQLRRLLVIDVVRRATNARVVVADEAYRERELIHLRAFMISTSEATITADEAVFKPGSSDLQLIGNAKVKFGTP